ncbi:MAG: alpha/beta fold hydrolase [Myxococcota bacterium]
MSGLWVVALGVVAVLLALGYAAYRRRVTLPAAHIEVLPTPSTPVEPAVVEIEPPVEGTRYPVVLLHGAFGFEELRIQNERHAYFYGVRERLEAKGVEVHTPEVSPVAGIRTRAKQLVRYLDGLGLDRVNIVAHSMGGLDSRYAITHFGLHERVSALVTIGSPHRGTPLANLSNSVTTSIGIRRLLGHVGEMFRDLTTRRMALFNEDTPDHEGVYYASVVGRAKRMADVHPLLLPTFQWLAASAGDNDGIIPADSQEWGEVLFIVDADHWAQVGWSRSEAVEPPKIYEAIADALAERGF